MRFMGIVILSVRGGSHILNNEDSSLTFNDQGRDI